MSDWPFTSPPSLGVITDTQIVQESAPILHVRHDADDGAWQFLGSKAPTGDQTTVVRLQMVVLIDPSLNELADLPVGWRAWRRDRTEPWVREEMAA